MRDQRERGACVTFPDDAPTIVEEGDRAPPTPVLEDSQMVISIVEGEGNVRIKNMRQSLRQFATIQQARDDGLKQQPNVAAHQLNQKSTQLLNVMRHI